MSGKLYESNLNSKDLYEFIVAEDKIVFGIYWAVKQMSLGEKSQVICPPEYAYGKEGIKNIVPPNTAIVYELHLVSIRDDP